LQTAAREGRLVEIVLGGAPEWSILNAEIAEELDLFDVEGEPITLSTRCGPIAGIWYRCR
jgi:hypothetical protein